MNKPLVQSSCQFVIDKGLVMPPYSVNLSTYAIVAICIIIFNDYILDIILLQTRVFRCSGFSVRTGWQLFDVYQTRGRICPYGFRLCGNFRYKQKTCSKYKRGKINTSLHWQFWIYHMSCTKTLTRKPCRLLEQFASKCRCFVVCLAHRSKTWHAFALINCISLKQSN